jgi:hypothetical protein
MTDDILEVIRSSQGLTASQIARRLFGIDGYAERVNGVCRVLAQFGHVERRGRGGPGDPFTYYPTEAEQGLGRSPAVTVERSLAAS